MLASVDDAVAWQLALVQHPSWYGTVFSYRSLIITLIKSKGLDNGNAICSNESRRTQKQQQLPYTCLNIFLMLTLLPLFVCDKILSSLVMVLQNCTFGNGVLNQIHSRNTTKANGAPRTKQLSSWPQGQMVSMRLSSSGRCFAILILIHHLLSSPPKRLQCAELYC